MANRILLGKDSSNYGLKISKPGDNVASPSEPLLFDSSGQSGSGRYFITKSTIDMGSYINQHFALHTDKSVENMGYTYNSTLYRYLPLVLVIEDALGLTFTSSGSTYYTSNSANYRSFTGNHSSSTINEYHRETAAMYRVSHRYQLDGSATGGLNGGAPSTYNLYRHSGDRYTIRSYCWAGSAGDLGKNFALFDENSSDNAQWNTYGNYSVGVDDGGAGSSSSYITGYIPRQKFRVASSGRALNSTWFRKTDGGIHDISADNSGGAPISNAKTAMMGIPCGYGFMNSNFMGF